MHDVDSHDVEVFARGVRGRLEPVMVIRVTRSAVPQQSSRAAAAAARQAVDAAAAAYCGWLDARGGPVDLVFTDRTEGVRWERRLFGDSREPRAD